MTIEKDGQNQKYYLAAEPQYKQINIYDQSMKSVKRELLQRDNTQEQSQATNKIKNSNRMTSPKNNSPANKKTTNAEPRKGLFCSSLFLIFAGRGFHPVCFVCSIPDRPGMDS